MLPHAALNGNVYTHKCLNLVTCKIVSTCIVESGVPIVGIAVIFWVSISLSSSIEGSLKGALKGTIGFYNRVPFKAI